MNNKPYDNESQLKNLLYTLKILSVFFSVVPIFQYLFKGASISELTINNTIVTAVVSAIILALILSIILLMTKSNVKSTTVINAMEIFLFFILFLIAIYFSGINQSYYKFIFVFLIISCTIQYSKKVGFIVSAIASASLIALDLIFKTSTGVNIYLENDLALCVTFFIVTYIIGLYSKIQKDHIDYLAHQANLDGLTEIYNHRYFYGKLKTDSAEALISDQPLCLIILDIDYFKIYNDLYGHPKGDLVLKQVVNIISNYITNDYTFCRYGGEEFAVILPNTTIEQASTLANAIRKAIYDFNFDGESALPNGTLTVSVGVSKFEPNTEDYRSFVKRADDALYKAKYLRRNRVEIHSSIIDRFTNQADNDNEDTLYCLKTLLHIINSKDMYTYTHTVRVVNYCDAFAKHLNLSDQDTKILIYAAYLHDLGKLNVDKKILIKNSPLTDKQWEQIKNHPSDGAEIIKRIDGLEKIAEIVIQHHEKVDGTGYPNRINGDQINHLAKILTICDSFDAMTNHRPYNKKKSFDEAFIELRRCAGTQFDTNLVEEFILTLKTIKPYN